MTDSNLLYLGVLEEESIWCEISSPNSPTMKKNYFNLFVVCICIARVQKAKDSKLIPIQD